MSKIARFGSLVLGTLLALVLSIEAQQISGGQPLRMITDTLPQAVPDENYRVMLEATGGVPPLRWRISEGKLPRGLQLQAESGVISGVPSETGQFAVTLTVADSARPAREINRDFTFSSAAALSLEWKTYPAVTADRISGSATVANGTKETFDQTVIIMAVNEYGKAFALGYQHFDLKPNAPPAEITFGSTLPRGHYVVHADAIAEVAARHAIYRGRLETPSFSVTSP